MDSHEKKVLLYLNARSLFISAGVLILVFLAGYAVAFIGSHADQRRTEELRHQLESVSQRLTIAELRGTVGLMSYEASRNNYTAAAKYSTEFFDGVRTAIEQTESADVRRPLEATLARRDEITTDLAQANPAVKEKLVQMYVSFFHIDSSA